MIRRNAQGAGLTGIMAMGFLVLLIVGGGCASIKVTQRDEYTGKKITRPDQILVHDFAATVGDLPGWSEAKAKYAGIQAPASAEEVQAGRMLGVEMTQQLVKRIEEMGLTAERATERSQPVQGDIEIVGYLTSFDEGSGFKRVALGFGSGAAEITINLEGYVSTQGGRRKLGSGTASSAAGKSPGVVVPLILTVATANPLGMIVMLPLKVGQEVTGRNKVEGVGKRMADKIADELEIKFREQGWIDR